MSSLRSSDICLLRALPEPARPSRISSRDATCSMAARTVCPAAWACTTRPLRSMVASATAGRARAGSAATATLTRADRTGSAATRSSEPTLAAARSADPWDPAVGLDPHRGGLGSPSHRQLPSAVTGKRSLAAMMNGASRITVTCPSSSRARCTISSSRSGTDRAAVPPSGHSSLLARRGDRGGAVPPGRSTTRSRDDFPPPPLRGSGTGSRRPVVAFRPLSLRSSRRQHQHARHHRRSSGPNVPIVWDLGPTSAEWATCGTFAPGGADGRRDPHFLKAQPPRGGTGGDPDAR